MNNLNVILNACLRVYGADFTVNNRKRNNVYARAVFYALCRKYTNQSFENIGKVCGNRDHSTVIYAVRKSDSFKLVPEYLKLYAQFEKVVDGLILLKSEKEIETYYNHLIEKIKFLEAENKKLLNKVYRLNKKEKARVTDPIQKRITKTIMGLPDNILEDFEKYRLNPYLKLQESKVIN